MVEQQAKLANLSSAKKALLLKKLAEKRSQEPVAPNRLTIPVRPADAAVPLTSSQERLWFLQRYAPAGGLYNLPIALRMTGTVYVPALEKALTAVIKRHAILSTLCYQTEQGVFQRPGAAAAFRLPFDDLTADDQSEARLREILREMADYSFDPENEPLIRVRLVQLNADTFVLATCAHHMITDGWSVNVFMRDFAAFYQQELTGRPADLPELPIQFADYAVWQRQSQDSPAAERGLAFWDEYLSDVPQVLDLPLDFQRPETARHEGAHYEFSLDDAVKRQLLLLAREQRVSMFVLMLTAFAVLLLRLSGQRQCLIGCPFAGRSYAELENLIGFFVNSLPIKVDGADLPSFAQLLQRTQHSFLDADAHQQVPFEKIVERLQPERSDAVSPLFQVMFTYANAVAQADMPGLSLQPLAPEKTTAKFDLILSFQETANGVDGSVEYDTAVFTALSIEHYMQCFQVLLQSILAQPHRGIAELDWLPVDVYRRVVYQWNDCRTDFPRQQTLPEGVQRHVEQRPDAWAVIHGERRLSYRELNQAANRLAERLRHAGVVPGAVVALYLQRSCDFIVAMLATLKAGGTYLPLDLAYPVERLVYMHQQAGAVLTLTQSALRQNCEQFGQTRVLLIDEAAASGGRLAVDPPQHGSAGALAYVMFTSGSTGRPKGIGISHASINRLVLTTNYITITPQDRVAQVNNAAFDATTFEIWGALLNGACLVIADREVSLTAEEFTAFLHQQDISVLLLTTAIFNQTLLHQPTAFAQLRCVLFGGEKVDPEAVRRVLKHGKPKHLLHIYGPTESTTFASCYEIVTVQPQALTVPIGGTLSNTRLYVLDQALNPVPIGVSGELYIGGEGLSPAYMGQPLETASKFIPDPFTREPGERMYRSGDIVRWNHDGDIEFIGRADSQVKIGGFRVEPGAVEAAIAKCSGVRSAYIKVSEQGGSGKHLIGYFTVFPGTTFAAEALWQELQNALPYYMLPKALVLLPTLPLTPNGKIDSKALPSPVAENYRQVGHTPPQTETEIRLAAVWQQLLGVAAGRESDFFALGGHSLLAMQLVNRIQTTFAIKLAVRDVFVQPQLAELATLVEASQPERQIPLVATEPQSSYPLSFAQERLYFLQALYPDSSAYNIVTAVKLAGQPASRRLAESLHHIVRRHDILRAYFVLEHAEPRQIIADEPVAIELADWRTLAESDRRQRLQQLLAEQSEFRFQLDQFPLIQIYLIDWDADSCVLIMNNHHILSDGWSQTVFLRELMEFYRQAAADVPALPIQYVDYAVWQRRHLTETELAGLLSYWRQQLASMPPAMNLHADAIRKEQPAVAAVESFELHRELTGLIRSVAARTQCSVFTLMSAVFTLFLSRYSGQRDIAIGTPVANREHQQTENLIGFFANTLVLRHHWQGNPSLIDFLGAYREMVLEAFAHQALPFEKLVEALQPERDLARSPLFQVMFVYHQAATPIQLPDGLQLQRLPLPDSEAKFDLTLAVQESDGPWQAAFEYDSGLFDAGYIQAMAECFVHFATQLMQWPGQPVSALGLLPPGQYQRVVNDWNRCPEPWPEATQLHRLFARSAERWPDRLAIEHATGQLTYRVLHEQSKRLADVLTAQGAGPETLIGLCLPRTPQLIVAMLAILKSGAAYVPLDPAYPSQRLENTLADADVLLLLTESSLIAHHAGLKTVPHLLLDQPWPQVEPRRRTDSGAANLAYILYTSGSTGRPKGVAITHASAVTMVQWGQRVFSTEQLSRVLAGTSICFDLSVFEIFLTLSSGGTIVLLANVVELADYPETKPSLINTVPSAAEELLRAQALPDSVKTVNLAGEPLSPELVDRLYAKNHIERVYDLYGPSEDTTYSTYTLRQARMPASIGRPISHTQAYVLDAAMQPVPVGVAGELYLSGMGLARGYHDRPGLTAEKFLPNPFAAEGQSGSRLYKTGDLVSYSVSGELHYLGRVDQQVKVRGFRIELGEVETVLAAHALVEDCLVVTVGDAASSDRKLVAYVKAPAAESESELIETLLSTARRELPKFMLPAAIVVLKEFPLTPNGKVDRKALPDAELGARDKEFVAAAGFVQQTLEAIWREILELARPVSSDEDFFELGGHSLLVLDLMSQLKLAFGKTLPLAAIFQAPTIRGLAGLIEADEAGQDWSPLVAIQPQGSRPALYCLHPVGGQVLCYHALAKALGNEQPVYGLRASGTAPEQPVLRDLPEMATYYLHFIRAAKCSGPFRLLGYSFGGLVAYELARQLESAGEEVAWVALLDTPHPALTADQAAATDDADFLVSLFPELGFNADQLRSLPKSQQLKNVFAKAKEAGHVPRAMDDEAVERYFDVCRSNLAMSYTPEPIRAPVRLIRARQESLRVTNDDYLGWRQVPSITLTLDWVNGRHENMLELPHAASIAELLGR